MKIYKTLPNGVRIVEYEHSMAQAVADMWNVSGDSWGGDMSVSTAADIMTGINGGAYLNVYLAEMDGAVLGYASLSTYFRDGKALYLHVLNVRPEYHGHKIGKALVLQCVERTIELGYPRLDIHTWPGNTKSVPLYKKCGYMWEDRVDSTHLVNFIPTVIAAEACKNYFETADWYNDSVRVIEVKPDGVKQNGFEVFTYAWEKDGRRLSAGFERTGRRMRLLETDDYRVSFMAECHEPAFGLDYGCAFEVENKTGKPLHLRIDGKNDGNIRFNYTAEGDVTGTRVFDASFTVDEITEPQDIWQVHPCVLADVYVNGLHAEFGLGIETKWPVSLQLEELKKIAVPGTEYACYFNLTSYLRSDAEVTVRIPQNSAADATVTRFDLSARTVPIPALAKTSFKIQATAIGYGYEAVPVQYDIKLTDGRTLSFSRTLHVSSRGLTGACAFETETDYILQNGVWLLGLSKNGAYAWTNHAFDAPSGLGFPIGQLGKPYNDEFERMKPVSVRMYRRDEAMVMEAVYRSAAFAGAEYTAVYTLTAAGEFTRLHRVANIGSETLSLVLKDETRAPLGRHTVLPYNGGIQKIRDGLSGEASVPDASLIDENWVYEDHPRYPRGLCWPAQYKVNVRWGVMFFFEHDCTLEPGQTFETLPVTAVHGLFGHFNDFRDYARQSYTPDAPLAAPHIEWTLNHDNPFCAAEEWTASWTQHRNERLEGEIGVQADTPLETGVSAQAFTKAGERRFTLKPGDAMQGRAVPVSCTMNLSTFDKTWTQYLFSPDMRKAVKVTQENNAYTCDNGTVSFRVDPQFSDACFSFKKDGYEWLLSNYPSREPYAWFNPFAGGINTELDNMSDAMTLREPITASEAEVTDSLGNVWRGLSSTVRVENFEEHKSAAYTQYYLTLPGLPVLCVFTRLHNQTGLYKKLRLHTKAFFGQPSDIKALTVSGRDENHVEYRYHVGSDSCWRTLDRLVAVEAEGQSDALYCYRDTTGDSPLEFGLDTCFLTIESHYPAQAEDGSVFTSKPLFMIVTPHKLTAESLSALDRVRFA